MSFLTDGEIIHLVATSKPDFIAKVAYYEEGNYVMVPHSYTNAGYAHKWRMQKTEDAVILAEYGGAAKAGVSSESTLTPEDTSEDLTESNEPSEQQEVTDTFSTKPSEDFLPDWDKVDNFLKDNDEKTAKQLLDDYAETFGVKLNRRSNFANMKAKFIEECSK